uniref:MutT/nudix n=1 Tax=uncultured marine crenarchaeote E37-7F TaxID=907717 RepID=G9BAR7_9ARCH|nr:MutT/nudix [uncultured marine crenarchaeote E37-7F]
MRNIQKEWTLSRNETSILNKVVLILRDNDMLLFAKRSNAEKHLKGWIPLPAGGHIEVEETAEEAIIREAREELGIVVKITRFLGQVKHKDQLLVFEGKPLSGDFILDRREIEEIKWIPINQAKIFSINILTDKILALL